MIGKLLCWIVGRHDWVYWCDKLKRRCDRCGKEEWVFEKPFTDGWEPRYHWKDTTIR